MHLSLVSLGCAPGFAPPVYSTFTAFRALKVAQRRLRPDVRSKLLSISSVRTEAASAPEAWRFVFSDSKTHDHCRNVIVAAKTSSEHPYLLEAFSLARFDSVAPLKAIPQNKLHFDSNEALAQVRRITELKETCSAVYRLFLPQGDREPAWLLSFYAANPEPIAIFRIRAETGVTHSVDK